MKEERLSAEWRRTLKMLHMFFK